MKSRTHRIGKNTFFFIWILFSLGMLLALSTEVSAEPAASQDQKALSPASQTPPSTGNFILPGSQQPGSFISFGQNILDKDSFQIMMIGDKFAGVNQYYIDFYPLLIYGLSDQFSLNIYTPYAVKYKQDAQDASGMEDSVIQLEYAFYQKSTTRFTDQATIVGNISFPTGSIHKNPQVGFGSPTVFLGTTYIRTYTKWFAFTSHGAQWTTTNQDHIKYGNNFFYEFGLGRNIKNFQKKWILAGLVELDGDYTAKDKDAGRTNPNSGGNVVYLTPSFWLSSKHLILQGGIGYPIIQQVFGNQNKNTYLLVATLAWTFN